MNDPTVVIRLDGNGRTYRPGEVLAGEYWFASLADGQISAIEVSVLWYSEGKGDEDLAVHEFWRHDGEQIAAGRPARFQTTLPNSPLTYDGQILKLRWCVRVRAFLQHGKEVFGQKIFRVGSVPPVKVIAP